MWTLCSLIAYLRLLFRWNNLHRIRNNQQSTTPPAFQPIGRSLLIAEPSHLPPRESIITLSTFCFPALSDRQPVISQRLLCPRRAFRSSGHPVFVHTSWITAQAKLFLYKLSINLHCCLLQRLASAQASEVLSQVHNTSTSSYLPLRSTRSII